MIHTVLADDEVLARQKLRQLLRNEPEIDVVGEGATAIETIELVRATKPQLLFLDIQMPGMDGFDVATELCSDTNVMPKPHIIFTTAHDQYARLGGKPVTHDPPQRFRIELARRGVGGLDQRRGDTGLLERQCRARPGGPGARTRAASAGPG